jgi:hypothetical protein
MDSLPTYYELYPSSTFSEFTTDHLLSPTIGPTRYSIQSWYKTLVSCHKARGSRVFVVKSIEHHKQPWHNLQDEFLMIRVVPLGTDEEASTIIIGRTIEGPYDFVRPPLLSQLGIQGPAIDQVMVLPKGEHDVTSQQPLSSISWCSGLRGWFAPRLLDLSEILRHISIIQPDHNILTTQCCWFARAAYLVTRAIYQSGYQEQEWDKHWDLSPVSRFGTVPRITSHPTCEALRTLIAYNTHVLGRD